MHSSLSNIRVAGIAVTTGSIVRDFIADGLAAGLDRVALERTAQTIGLHERRVAAPGVTALDLCADATERLLAEMGLDATSIDAVIFVTQTPDHGQPNNASLLHGRLGLSKSAPAYDLSLGCSGWVYGLHQAALLCAHGGAGRVLLCAGDTLSRLTNPADRSTDPLFGDAGSATIIEKTEGSKPMYFVLGADGAGAEAIIVKQGGARQPGGPLQDVVDKDGNQKNDANLVMNGADVFSFTLREVPAVIKTVLVYSGYTPETTEALLVHQANRFIVSTIAKKTGFTDEQAPAASFSRYGNQSSASIPCVLIEGFGVKVKQHSIKIVGCGFGVGLSWGALAGEFGPLVIAPTLSFPR